MKEAIKEAQISFDTNCVPVGAIIVLNDEIVGKGRNKSDSFLMHAEIECIRNAERNLSTKYLDECEIFVTMEPCMMCLYAIFLSRVRRAFFGAFSDNDFESEYLCRNKVESYGGFLEKESSELLKTFFLSKRKKNVDFK